MSVHFQMPSTKNSTELTPLASVALAATVTVPLTVAPLTGEVIQVWGAVWSAGVPPAKSEWRRRLGEPAPAPVTLFWLARATIACPTIAGVAVGLVSR